MAFATFSLSLLLLFIFLDGFRKSIILSILIGALFIFLAIYIHPFYNDSNVIESTQYHQGQKIEKFFQCESDTEKICSKIINIQPSFFEVIKNFSTSAYGEIYLLSYKMFLDSPIIGIGPNNFRKVCNNQKYFVNQYSCSTHPHNTFIQIFAEIGIVGLLFILMIILAETSECRLMSTL